MKKRWIYYVLLSLVIMIPISSLGCLEDDSSSKPSTPLVTPTDQQQNGRIDAVEKLAANHETKLSTIDAVVNVLKGQQSTAPPVSKAEFDSLVGQVNSLKDSKTSLESRLKTAEDEIKAIRTGTTTPTYPYTGGTTPTGSISVTTSPAAIQILGGSQMCYTMRITNNSGTWQYVKPILTLQANGTTTVTDVDISMSWGSFNMTGISGIDAAWCWQVTPLNVATNSILMIPTQCGVTNQGEVQLASGQSVDLLVCIAIHASVNQIWTVTHSFSNRSI